MMKTFRALRVGSFDLAAHSWHRLGLPTPNCNHCGCPETTDHFLFCCPLFTNARSTFIEAVSPILKTLGSQLSTPSVLGLFDVLANKAKERETRSIRRDLIEHTLQFLKDSGRCDKSET